MFRIKSLSIVLFVLCVAVPKTTFAKPPPAYIFWWGVEKIVKVADLPNHINYQGKSFDLGYIYKRFTLLYFIPLWSYDGRYCGYVGPGRDYVILENGDAFVSEMERAGIDIPSGSPISFMDRFGLLVILGVFLLLCVLGGLGQQDSEISHATDDTLEGEGSSQAASNLQNGWYFIAEGQEIGPVSAKQLKALAEKGLLKYDSQVRRATQDQWYQASQVPGLF